MKNPELEQTLAGLDEKQLCAIILELAGRNKENAEWLEMRLRGEDALPAAMAHYKRKIRGALFSERTSLRAARRAFLDFKRLKPGLPLLLDMMVSYVEIGVEVENKYGDLYEAFYSSMESVFKETVTLLNKNPALIAQFRPRLEKIVNSSAEGWGHRDTLSDWFEELGVEKHEED